MRPNPKPMPHGNRARFLATRPKARAVQASIVKTICARVGQFRTDMEQWGATTVRLANDARAIGLYVVEFLDALPGKQLTIDFWRELSGQFVDQTGHPITQEQLRIFARIAQNNPEEITDLQVAMSWRQPLLGAAGFELVSERPPGHAVEVNRYNRFFEVLSPVKINSAITSLESDPHYGPMEQWPEELKQTTWLQIRPAWEQMREVARKLNPVGV